MFWIFLLVLYFLIMGSLTMLESKLLAMIQNSVSIFKFSLLGMYNFYLDFLKVLMKGSFSNKNKSLFINYLNLLGIFILISLSFMTLLFSFLFKNFFIFSLITFLVLDGVMLLLKMVFLGEGKSSFTNLAVLSISGIYIFMEGIFFYMVFFLVMFCVNLNKDFGIISFLIMKGFYFIFFILMGIMITIKLFSTPFDYFESESELVGGGVLELHSWGFLMWSLLEYGLIFNNSLFLLYLLNLFLNMNIFFNMLILLIFLSMIFIISGLLVSVGFNSLISFLLYFLFMINLIFLIVMTC